MGLGRHPPPDSAAWSGALAGETQQIAGAIPLTFVEPNGSFAWAVSAPPGYAAYGATGTVGVEGGISSLAPFPNVGAIVLFSFVQASSVPMHSAPVSPPSPLTLGRTLEIANDCAVRVR